jgi:hypothetical protein
MREGLNTSENYIGVPLLVWWGFLRKCRELKINLRAEPPAAASGIPITQNLILLNGFQPPANSSSSLGSVPNSVETGTLPRAGLL